MPLATVNFKGDDTQVALRERSELVKLPSRAAAAAIVVVFLFCLRHYEFQSVSLVFSLSLSPRRTQWALISGLLVLKRL